MVVTWEGVIPTPLSSIPLFRLTPTVFSGLPTQPAPRSLILDLPDQQVLSSRLRSPGAQAFLAPLLRGPNLPFQLEHSPPKSSAPSSPIIRLTPFVCISRPRLYQQGASLQLLTQSSFSESLYLQASLPLHQSDAHLKASNLPCISLINSEFPAFIAAWLQGLCK